MYRGIFSLFFIFTILASFVSESYEKKAFQVSNKQDQHVEIFSEVMSSVAFYEKNDCDQCGGKDCQRDEGCCINLCSCIPHFSLANSQIAFIKKGAIQEKTLWSFTQSYKSHSIDPELQPPRFS